MVRRAIPNATGDLFAKPSDVALADGAVLLRGFANAVAIELLAAVEAVVALAPWRPMVTPGGKAMSVRSTNCGDLGWYSDRRGYRYVEKDPLTEKRWPAIPDVFVTLARAAAERAGYSNFQPEACLLNNYAPGTQMTRHQDKDELDNNQPIVSVSLGLPARFIFGGDTRNGPVSRHWVEHGDVAVWGGASRMAFHGIAPLPDGMHPLTGARRINITFRRAR